MVGVYSAVPPPSSAQKPAAAAAKKTQDSESPDTSDDSSDEEDKKIPGKGSHVSKFHVSNTLECSMNGLKILTAKTAPVKSTTGKPGVPKPAPKEADSSSGSSGNY